MKVYIAAPWVNKAEAIAAAEKVTAAGHEVTSHWFNHPGDPTDSTGKSSPDNVIYAQAHIDWEDVLAADAVVVLNLTKSEGKAVETGIALQAGKKIIFVGTERTNIFQTLAPWVETVEAAIEQLGR